MKEIPLTKGKVALVDDEDYEYLNQFKWCVTTSPNTQYAVCGNVILFNNKWEKGVRMHRLLLQARPRQIVDHKNHDGLDNQRHNIRICTHQQNTWNSRPHTNGYSKYKGVLKQGNRWSAHITINGYSACLGTFGTEEEAARRYDKSARLYHKDFACLNFPE